MPEPTYAWCFDHGRLHIFRLTESNPDPWCTANWMPLTGATEDEALADKQQRYEDAQFIHHLDEDQQWHVIEVCALRYDRRATGA